MHGKRFGAGRLMEHGLSMTADRTDVLGAIATVLQKRQHRITEQMPQIVLQFTHRNQGGWLADADIEQPLLEVGRNRVVVVSQQFDVIVLQRH
ncbi:Uncharacterised protein [Vibrio cholerae]|nr:Uncharacterised protein [Vibrio cholerae]